MKLLSALLISLAGLSTAASAQTVVAEGPNTAAFWDTVPMPALEGASRGDIYWVQERDDAPAGAQGWNVIYVSESATGRLEYVSGEIYVPRTQSETERPMIIWATGTTGPQDSCAPSRNGLRGVRSNKAEVRPFRVPGIESLLARGYAVVMSDYQGSGTPGPTAYLQGDAQAKASLDIARAARNFPPARVGTDIGAYGFSQGGQTALWLAHIAQDYAPEFQLAGILPIAPASRHVDLSFYDLGIPVNSGYFIARMAGLQVGHPELQLRDVLTEAGLELLTAQSWGCYEIFGAAAALTEPYAKPEALTEGTPWRNWLEANDEFLPIDTSIPILLIQGETDVDVPVELTREVSEDLCEQGNQVQYIELPGADHSDAFNFSATGPLVSDWFDARFTGTAVPSSCG